MSGGSEEEGGVEGLGIGREGGRLQLGERIKGKRNKGDGEVRVGEMFKIKKGKGESNSPMPQHVMGRVGSESRIRRRVANV